MSLQHGLLGLLNYGAMTGYELGKAFNASLSFFWRAQSSQIYRELNKMEEMEWLTSHIEFQTDKPNKRIYAITDKGNKELQIWLQSDLPKETIPTRSEILMRLFFSAQNSVGENIKVLKKIAGTYQNQCDELENINDNIAEYSSYVNTEEDALYWEMTADFGRAYSKMCLDWAESCIKRLEGLDK